jgi:hypothetical protein
MAPSSLTFSLGYWVASLERLRALQLDLTGRTGKAVFLEVNMDIGW